jgi:DNA repair protein RadC
MEYDLILSINMYINIYETYLVLLLDKNIQVTKFRTYIMGAITRNESLHPLTV